MKKPQGRGGDKSRSAEDNDDIDLWQHAASSIEPLRRAKGRFHPATEAVKSAAPAPKRATEKVSHKPPSPPVEPPKPEVQPQRVKPPDLALFDRNSARKIRGGRVEIEARVDLHGMRQHEAHTALKRFLQSAQSRGLRYVLIITGKGKGAGPAGEHVGEGDRERGVLKRNVPRWLEEPDLRAVVVSFATAAIRHGGEGAIYVHLRSKARS